MPEAATRARALPDPRPDERWALFLDFDGTLVDLALTPDGVAVDPALPGHLATLRDRLGGALAIVTGRSAAVIDAALAPWTFDVAGLHGHEFRRAADRADIPAAARGGVFRDAVGRLARRVTAMPGVILEDKGEAVAVHWRLAPAAAEEARGAVREVANGLGTGFRIQEGHAVVEILPAAADKGAAMARFLTLPPFLGRRPIVAGDDLTDEAGFFVANAKAGFSLRIGPGVTCARHRMESAAAFRAILAMWAEGAPIEPETDFP